MRILILSPWLPHAAMNHAGGAYLWRLVTSLGERGHAVHLICYGRGEPSETVAVLEQRCASLDVVTPAHTTAQKLARLREGDWRRPWTWGRRSRLAVREHLRRRCEETPPDVVHLIWTEMGRYLEDVPEGVATLLNPLDVEHQVRPREVALLPPGRRRQAQRRARRLIREELRALPRADAVVAVSGADAVALAALRGAGDVYVVPPWVDVAALRAIGPGSVVPGRLTFMGALDRAANQAAACFLIEEVWPRVRAACAHATLHVVGAHPPEMLRRRAAGDPRLEVTGWVRELAPIWAATDVATVPSLVGGGCLLKVAQPLAAGRPVVTTPLGNAGVAAPVDAIALADTPEAFAAAVVALLTDRERWRRLAERGRQHALLHFDWEIAIDHLEAAYRAAQDRRQKRESGA